MVSPGGDSHEPLAVTLQPYFLSQPQLSLLKICPSSVTPLTVTSFPMGSMLWDQKKSTRSPEIHSHFSYRPAFSTPSVTLCLSFSTRFSEWVWAPSSESPACGQREIKFQGQEGRVTTLLASGVSTLCIAQHTNARANHPLHLCT